MNRASWKTVINSIALSAGLLLCSQSARAEESALDGILGFDYARGLFSDRMIFQDTNEAARTWGVHLNNGFLKTGPVGTPANLNYSKSKDESSKLSYDMALRLEFGEYILDEGGIIPAIAMRPYVGAELHRQDGEDANDSRQYFGVLSLYPSGQENLTETDPMFLIGGAYVDDVVNDSAGTEVILEYRPWKAKEEKTVEKAKEMQKNGQPKEALSPLVRLAALMPGEGGSVPFDFQLIPMFALEALTADPENPVSTSPLNTAAKKLFRDAVKDKLDNQFARCGFQLKMSVFTRIEIAYELAQRYVISDFSEDHLYQEVNASVKVGKLPKNNDEGVNAVSAGLALNIKYSKGENLPTLKDEDKVLVGLGVAF